MKTRVGSVLALCALVIVPACEDDPTAPASAGDTSGRMLMPPTTRNAILNNIEYGYNKRIASVIDDLLNENFTFFFAPGDVGGNVPEQWGRVDEYDATSRLFNSNNQPDPPTDPVCLSILVDIQFDYQTEWVPVSPEGFPGETWHTATASYSFTNEVYPDARFHPVNGARAQFTVRDTAPGDDERWELVEWRDLGWDIRSTLSGQGTEEVTWGAIKAIYRH
jgi:hypothetical protein